MFRVFTAVWCLQGLPGVCMNLGLWVFWVLRGLLIVVPMFGALEHEA